MENSKSNINIQQQKLSFTIKSDSNESYKFTIYNEEDDLIFIMENLKEFPIKKYELKISLKKLKEMDECFDGFKNAQKFINNGIKKTIESKKYNLIFSEEEKCVIFHMKHDIFDQDYVAKIKIPEKEQDLKEQVENLTKIVSKLKEKVIINDKNDENNEEKKEEIQNEQKEDITENKMVSFLNKEETAKNSFTGTSFLK